VVQKAADARQADAMYNLGGLYANGKGVTQDDDKARVWYQKAADAGNKDADKKIPKKTWFDHLMERIRY
jgi:TPR repeat protein